MIERVNVDTDGLDEIVGAGRFHLERMDEQCWYLCIDGLAIWIGHPADSKARTPVVATPIDGDNWFDWRSFRRHPSGSIVERLWHLVTELLPGATASIDPAGADAAGSWFLDIGYDGRRAVVEWSPARNTIGAQVGVFQMDNGYEFLWPDARAIDVEEIFYTVKAGLTARAKP